MLVVDWASWAGQVVDLVNFNVKWQSHIMSDKLKLRMVQKVFNITFAACEKVIDANDFITSSQEPVYKVAAKKTGSAGD